jgi:hypothetical protein
MSCQPGAEVTKKMAYSPMEWFELPHWLIMAGALLLLICSGGVLLSKRKADEVAPPPDEPIDLPPLPLLHSKSINESATFALE